MSKNTKTPRPLLSIGIIFKNEIRCLERCMKSLAPLREAIPCELVMADTGSDDGSREVAEEYADILIDFPWVGDFAAARNAVMDRCSGRWYLTVDADEWLDEDFSELVGFLRNNKQSKIGACTVVVRNYTDTKLAENYSDFLAGRLLNMATGLRYIGAIHESWHLGGQKIQVLRKTVFHHDGYVETGNDKIKKKKKRNVDLLRKNLEENPDDLRSLLQYIESGGKEPDYLERLRHAADLTEKKAEGWGYYGPPVFRHAVLAAFSNSMPELEDWTKRAKEWFPDSFFTLIDVNAAAFLEAVSKSNFALSIEYGEEYLTAIADFEDGRGNQAGTMASTLSMVSAYHQRRISILLAGVYLREKKAERPLELLEGIDAAKLDQLQTVNLVEALVEFPGLVALEKYVPFVIRFWDEICASISEDSDPADKELAKQRKSAFLKRAEAVFVSDFIEKETEREDFSRHAYTVFLPLLGKCELGTAAAILESDSAEEIASYLHQVEDWNLLPESALSHALETGVPFPLPDKPLTLEEMDALAIRLSANRDGLFKMALETDGKSYPTMQGLSWARALTLAAVQAYNWKEGEKGVELARAFTALQKELLRRTYTEEMLREENVCQLPSMLRFSWYCIRAFEALDAGDPAGYVRRLREGLSGMPAMKEMVEFLAERSKEVQELVTPPELLELAAQVRMMLAAYPANDPAVAALKQSEAYQKVAYLLDTGSIQ